MIYGEIPGNFITKLFYKEFAIFLKKRSRQKLIPSSRYGCFKIVPLKIFNQKIWIFQWKNMQISSKIAGNCLKLIKKYFLRDSDGFPEKIRKNFFFGPKNPKNRWKKIFFGFRDKDIGVRKNWWGTIWHKNFLKIRKISCPKPCFFCVFLEKFA